MADTIIPPSEREMPEKSVLDYVKPRSLTWWSGVALIIGGVALIFTGNTEMGMAAVSAGLAAIGIRAQGGRVEAVLKALAGDKTRGG